MGGLYKIVKCTEGEGIMLNQFLDGWDNPS